MRLSRHGDSVPIAFVLAGGGSLGAVEVGMLQALTEVGVAPDFVVGASVGAINAVYFAGDPSLRGVEKLAQIWRGIRRQDVFPVSGTRGALALLGHSASLVDPTSLRRLLERRLVHAQLEQCAIPAHVVATDFVSGAERVLSKGSSVEALMASAAIPAIFPPVTIDGHALVDGGVANNTPLSAAVDLGARRLIVLPTGFSCHLASAPNGPLATALHALNLLIARQVLVDVQRLRGSVEIHVVPPLCPLARAAYDFSGTDELISRGAQSTREWLKSGGLERSAIPLELGPHSHS
jgi:NTE family protein